MTDPNPIPPTEILAAIERYRHVLPSVELQKLLAASAIAAPPAVRVNLLKTSNPAESLTELAERYGWQTSPVPYSDVSRRILSAITPPGQTLEHRLGNYYVQDAASILPVSLFSPSTSPHLVLDLAASPGGKTTQLIDSNLDHDFVIANDSSASRLSALRTVVQMWGSANHMISNFAGERFGDWYPETFDRILLDAPCSMESLRVSSSHPPRPITTDERARLASRQLALLSSAAKALKVGGELVYSTCTLAPEEDEAVVSALLDLFPSAFRVDKPDQVDPRTFGLPAFANQVFAASVVNSWRIWPHVFDTNGFFAVRLTKTAEIAAKPTKPPSRPFSATGFSIITPRQAAEIDAQIQDLYEISLISRLNQAGLMVCQRAESLHLLPKRYLEQFGELPFHSLGMPFGKIIHGKLALSVELINRFGNLFKSNIWIIPPELIAPWLSGQDLRNQNFDGLRRGTVVNVRDSLNRNLGAGKLSENRLRNLLPSRNLLR